ncbi:Calx-beta domain-containing protein [uncultured Chitinophaga sp.]|jgi:Calx-beta domain.|uniref:Calx-beta domain-containing protein n=1 Tax=uncultured Chitinophaga sp. TaxID=339340 RepID=UPI0026324DB9|nr:Calx-beta domain-containing protein [uncultured Chitinophaga sp.]
MSVFSYTVPSKDRGVFCKAVSRLQKCLVLILLLFTGSSVSAQVVETINETGGSASDPGLKIEILADGSQRVYKNGYSQTFEGTEAPRGLTTYIGLNNTYLDSTRRVNKVNWSFISPKRGDGTVMSPWRVQLVGNVLNYVSTIYGRSEKITVLCDISYVKDQAYFIMDYTVAAQGDTLTTKGHLYLAEYAALDATTGDWINNAACSKGIGPDVPPYTSVSLFRDDACGTYNPNRSHVLRMKKGFSSFLATDAAGMIVNIPESCWLTNIYNTNYDGTPNGMIVHTSFGDIYGGSATSLSKTAKVFSARILSGYGNSYTDFDAISDIDSIAPATDRQLNVEFESPAVTADEGSDRHSATGLRLKVYNKANSKNIVLTYPLYVPLKATPSGANPAVPGVDYECKRGILIPAGTYRNTPTLIDVDSAIMILGNSVVQSNRTVTFTLDNTVENLLLSVNSTANLCSYTIRDDEDVSLTFTAPTSLDEGQSTNATISLPAGVMAASDITITITRKSNSTTGSGDVTFPSTVVIRENTNSVTFNIQATGDKILEYEELLDLQADADVMGMHKTVSAAISIIDKTYDDPANRVISMRPVPGVTVGEPYNGGLQFSLPPGVTTEIPIKIQLGMLQNDPASTASVDDYTLDSIAFQITSGNLTTIPFTVIDDNLSEGTEKLHVTAVVTDNVPRTYEFPPYDILILDDDANTLKITASAPYLMEGGAPVIFTVALPPGTNASNDIPLAIVPGGTSEAIDYTELPEAAFFKISAGTNSSTFTLSALLDSLVEGDETLVLAGGSLDYNIIPFTINIKDSTVNIPANRKLQMSIVGGGGINEGDSVAMKVGFINPNIMAGRPIAVTITRNATSAASAADLGFASTTITIPAGEREITVNKYLAAQSDQVLENTEAFTLSGATSDIPGLTFTQVSDSILDVTGKNPANKVITITTQPGPLTENTAYNVTFSLPAGITTEVPINITPQTGAGSTAVNADYTFDPVPQLNNNNAAVTGVIHIAADGLLEPDETLVINATATGLPGVTFAPATVTLKDQDYVVGMPLTISADTTFITEGSSTGAMVTIALPAGKVTSYDIPVTITKDAASVATNAEHTGLPVTVIIKAGSGSVNFPAPIRANTDNLLEENESLIINASATGFTGGSLSLTIRDGSNPKVTLQPQPFSAGNTVEEGNTYTVRIALPAGITPYKPFNVTVTAGSASTAATTDYSGLPTTVTINPGENFKDITINALNDNIIEAAELLRLKAAVTGFAGITADSLSVTIDDLTGKDPANRQLRVAIDSATLHEGNSSRVIIGFVKPGITSAASITLTIAPDAAFTGAAADFSGLPASVTIPAGTNELTHTIQIVSDNLAEGTEILKLNTTVTAGYTVVAPANITIPEAPLQITAVKTADAAEPATNGGFNISLPGGLVAAADINVTLTIGGTASAADWTTVGTTAVIKAGTNSIAIPVKVIDDKLLEGNETVTLSLQQARMPRGSATVTFPVNSTTLTVNIVDDDINAAGRAMMVEKLNDASEPSTAGVFRIRFTDPALTVLRDVHVNYNVGGSATPGVDYTPVSGSLTIPAGQNGVSVNVTPVDDILVEGTETVDIEISNVSSTMTGVTWPLSSNPRVSIPLNDNDSMKLSLFADAAAIMEGGNIGMTLKSSAANKADVTVGLKVVYDQARSITTSLGPVNKIGDTLTAVLPAGTTEYTFNIATIDNVTNDDEGFVFLQVIPDAVHPENPVYWPALASDVNVVVGEDDSLKVSFKDAVYTVNEGNRKGEFAMTLEVQLSRASSRHITLPYSFPDLGNKVTFLGKATPGVDFDSSRKPIEIEPGQLSGAMTIEIYGDSSFERNDTFAIKLLPPVVTSNQNLPVTMAPDSVLGIIFNDDPFCPTCDSDGDGILDGEEDTNGNGDPLDDDADGDGIPNYLDDDSDNDGVPDAIEGWITDGRWVNNNSGKIRVHPAISPNGDGMGNDAMYIENIEKYERNEVVIFNRWGGTVFKTSNYNNTDNNFKGLNNAGKEVTDGSYFYRIQVWDSAGKQEQYVGFIVVKRK